MQRKHSSSGSRHLLWGLLILAGLLFFAAFLYSCSAQPQIYSSRGYVLFVPASSTVRPPVLSPWG